MTGLFLVVTAAWLAFNLMLVWGCYSLDRAYKTDGYPLRCEQCDSDEMDAHIKATINGQPCEVFTRCEQCDTGLSYWAYGSFDPFYRENYRQRLVNGALIVTAPVLFLGLLVLGCYELVVFLWGAA